jgi:hypothetical protein
LNRWARIVWTLSLLAAAGWIAGGWAGYEVRDGATLARHTLLVFAALLVIVLTHGWVAIYLVTFERLLARDATLSAHQSASLARARRRGAIGAALATIATVAQFAISNALYPARLVGSWHALAALVSSLALAFAAALEWRALSAAGGVARTQTD